jgi:hypothetical protein
MVDLLASAPGVMVTEQTVKVQKNQMNAFRVQLHGKAGDVEKELLKFFESKYKAKFSKNKGAQEAPGLMMGDVIAETVTLLVLTEEKDNLVQAFVVVDLGGKALSSSDNGAAADKMELVLLNFARTYYGDLYKDTIGDQEKNLGKAEKEFEKVVSDGEKLVKTREQKTEDIAKAEKDITDAQAKIEQLKADIEKAKNEIQELEKNIESNKTDKEKQDAAVAAEKARLEKLKAAAASVGK